jgi:hypothetical protein
MRNPFMVVMAVLNVAAAAWYWHAGSGKLAGVTACYAVSSAILASL